MKDRSERQQQLLEVLNRKQDAVTGSDLASQMGVTRQVVVHDIAILRAAGHPILSTPRGYWLQPQSTLKNRYVLAVSHPPDLTQTELTILVDHGIHVLDVAVEHPLYGELRGSLHLASRRDVAFFMEQLKNAGATLLSSLTDGEHLHTVECSDLQSLNEASAKLRAAGIRVFDSGPVA